MPSESTNLYRDHLHNSSQLQIKEEETAIKVKKSSKMPFGELDLEELVERFIAKDSQS